MVRHYDQDERQSHASLHWDSISPILLKAFATHGARDFSDEQWLRLIHEGSSKTTFEYCDDSQKSLAYCRAIQEHLGGIPLHPVLVVYIRIPYNWKEYIFRRGCSFSIQPVLEWTDSGWTWKAAKNGRQSSSHHLILLVETPMKKISVTITQTLKKVDFHRHWKRNQDEGVRFCSTRRPFTQTSRFLPSTSMIPETCNTRS